MNTLVKVDGHVHTVAVSTVGIQLSTLIACRNIHFCEITSTGDLNIIWSLHEVYTLSKIVRNRPVSLTEFLTFMVPSGTRRVP